MVSYKCSLYFAEKNRRDGSEIEPGFKNLCISLEIAVMPHTFCTASSVWCSSFSDIKSRMKYVLTKRRCYRRAGRYIRLQDFLTSQTSLLFAWPLLSEGRYFSVEASDVSTNVFFRNLLLETMPKDPVKRSNAVFSFELLLFTFPNLLCL